MKRSFDFKRAFFIASLFFGGQAIAQPYAPPVGQPGTSAMHKDSVAFIAWAKSCRISRGYQDISNTSLGYASVGDSTMATAKAQTNGIVSLGDGGSAVCMFEKPVKNGPGYDFAVFENGFDDVFLELAFVEVSSDGINFTRFKAHSLTDISTQTGSFGSTDATKVNNLAGKYRGGYGTPFDLAELAGTPGLDINAVTHIKIVDVVGSVATAYSTFDGFGNRVNDPWPTAFPSGGFDLDAVGVIYENTSIGMPENELDRSLTVYPNPLQESEQLHMVAPFPISTVRLMDVSGKLVADSKMLSINTGELKPGMYLLQVDTEKGVVRKKIIVH
jgi:hypothetical protein